MELVENDTSQRFTVSHYDDKDFKTGGLRDYSAYRDLGVAAATNGLAQAHVIRMIAPFRPELSVRHHHDVATLSDLELPAETQVLVALSACANEAIARSQGREHEQWGATREICGRILAVHPRQLDDKLDELLAVRAAA